MRTYNMTMPALASVREQTLLTDNKPYLFRQSPVVAEMLDDTLTGGTVAWNQQLKNGNFEDGATDWIGSSATLSVTDGVARATLNGSAWNNDIRQRPANVSAHTYLAMSTNRASTAMLLHYRNPGGTVVGTNSFTATTSWERYARVFKFSATTPANGFALSLYGSGSALAGEWFETKDFNIIDLTQMFGSTVADYAYTLETQTAGSGLAWLQSYGFFIEDYCPHDSGSLLSVKTSGHKTVGFNQWDEEWEVGGYSTSTGQKGVDNTRIRCKNYIPCLPNTTYFNGSPQTMIYLWYDAGKNYIGYQGFTSNTTLTTPSNCHYMTFYAATAYGTTYNNDICINISDPSKNGTYEPYEEHSYPLSDIDLRGIPKLVNNELQYDGDVYESDGSVERRYKVVVLNGSDTPQGVSSTYAGSLIFNSSSPAFSGVDFTKPIFCNKLVYQGMYTTDFSVGGCINANGTSFNFWVKDTAFANVNEAKTWLQNNPLEVLCELATPTTETTDAFENPQVSGTTEQYVDERTVPMPVGHVTEYFNMKQIKRIQMFMPKEG